MNTPPDRFLGIPLHLWKADIDYVKRRLAYSSYVSLKNKYLYMEAPKAACTRIKTLIHAHEELPPIQVRFDRQPETRLYMFIHDRDAFRMDSLLTIEPSLAESVLREDAFFRFSFVRNPYSRLVSVWMNKIYFLEPGLEKTYARIRTLYPDAGDSRFISFPVFVRYVTEQVDVRHCNPHYALQSGLLFTDAIDYDYIGKVEEMSQGLEVLEKRLGFRDDSAGHDEVALNRSGIPDWRVHYNEELAGRVYEKYAADFHTFGYDRDSWKGSGAPAGKTPRERYLEEQIFDRNRLISRMYLWINQNRGKKQT